ALPFPLSDVPHPASELPPPRLDSSIVLRGGRIAYVLTVTTFDSIREGLPLYTLGAGTQFPAIPIKLDLRAVTASVTNKTTKPRTLHVASRLDSEAMGNSASIVKQRHRTQRVKLIYEAAANKDIEQLRRLARSEDGLLYDWLRRLAWPVLLHTWHGCYLRDKGSEQDLTDWKQISRDVERSLYLFSQYVPQRLKTHRQRELHELIVEILWRNPGLHYYQGFHDICTCFLLILGKKQAIPAAENVAFGNIVPYYALSWILTWYSHDVKDIGRVARLFDLFVASTPLMPVYVAVTIVLARKKELLAIDPDLSHSVLGVFPQNFDMDELVSRAVELERRWPPLELQKLSGVWLDD
ncbi:hypothetical protein BC937DRAFT_94975, partial [Endogone sp. FLAS-F59071]